MALRGRLIHGWIIVMTQGLLDTGAARVARMSGAISGFFWFIPVYRCAHAGCWLLASQTIHFAFVARGGR
jgi:hypothetical protein